MAEWVSFWDFVCAREYVQTAVMLQSQTPFHSQNRILLLFGVLLVIFYFLHAFVRLALLNAQSLSVLSA